MKKLHKEDKAVIINFIDYTRLKRSKPTHWQLEILARHCAEMLGINPDMSNAKLANRFAKLLESGDIS